MTSTPHPSVEQSSPSPAPSETGSTKLLNLLRIAILLILVGGSAYLLVTHLNWFEDPRLVKREVLDCGVWGPIAYILLFAVGPSFLVPGAVMTIAGGLAFGALWGALWSLIGADLGALVAFGGGRFLARSFVDGGIGGGLCAL